MGKLELEQRKAQQPERVKPVSQPEAERPEKRWVWELRQAEPPREWAMALKPHQEKERAAPAAEERQRECLSHRRRP